MSRIYIGRIGEPPPKPPQHYSDEQQKAWWRGYNDGQITGPDSLEVFTPYDVDDEAELYEAWQAGYDAA